jgi:excisionase family DNA binding protein
LTGRFIYSQRLRLSVRYRGLAPIYHSHIRADEKCRGVDADCQIADKSQRSSERHSFIRPYMEPIKLDHYLVTVDRLLTVNEAAALAGLKHLAVRKAINRGELAASKLCGRIRVDPADIRRWIAAGSVEPGSAAFLNRDARSKPSAAPVADSKTTTGPVRVEP